MLHICYVKIILCSIYIALTLHYLHVTYICISCIQLLVCGQALSHCVNFTFSDLLDEWPADKRARLVLLTDGRCTYYILILCSYLFIHIFDYACMLYYTILYTYYMYTVCFGILYLSCIHVVDAHTTC